MGTAPRALTPVLLFLLLTFIGLGVLLLPFSHAEDGITPFMDALFAAVSATTTAGLTTQDVSVFWTMPGQITLLTLTFISGLTFSVVAGLLLLNAGQWISSMFREDTGDTPHPANSVRFAAAIALVAVGIQLTGFMALLLRFSFVEPVPEAIWKAASMAVLAFNNAGFLGLHTMEDGSRLALEWPALTICSVLILLGAVSSIVILDMGRKRRWATLSLNTKIVLTMTGLIALITAFAVFFSEFENPATIGAMSLGEKVSVSAFEAVSARTSGLTAMGYEDSERSTGMLMMGLMLTGGASASLAGGIKVNTLAVLIIAVFTVVVGKRGAVSAFGREISFIQIKHAMTLCISMIGLSMLSAMLLTLAERGQSAEFIDIMFESVSAVSAAGLSTGLSAELTGWGKLIVASAMFIGRTLPLSLALFMIGSMNRVRYTYATERVTIG